VEARVGIKAEDNSRSDSTAPNTARDGSQSTIAT